MSNYEYLLRLNEASYRSFSDLTQYPVFPWVIADYESISIDLNNEKIYRDLSKPIGALNPKRLREYLERYESMENPKFMYGSHYSTPGYVIGYLVRKNPEFMLKLQSGDYDKPDRLFSCIKRDWENVINNSSNVKELIPQFFTLDDSFLKNGLGINFGKKQNGKPVDDVKLPKWANSPMHFLEINKKALESEYVSNNLHNWIDLIFGYKQRGPQAIEAFNVFHHLTYEGSVNLDEINDEMEKNAILTQINEFGQTPKQLFKISHPKKFSFSKIPMNISTTDSVKLDLGNNLVNNEKVQLATNILKKISDKDHSAQIIKKVHKGEINDILIVKNSLLTLGSDFFLKAHNLDDYSTLKSFKICNFNLSCIQQIEKTDVIAIGSWDNNIYFYNLTFGTIVNKIQAHSESVTTMTYSFKHDILLTSSLDCSVKSFKLNKKNFQVEFENVIFDNESQINCLMLFDDDELLVFGDCDGNIKYIDLESSSLLNCIDTESVKITNLMKIDDKIVASSFQNIFLLDKKGNIVSEFKITSINGVISTIQIVGRLIVVLTDKGNISVFDSLVENYVGHLFFNYEKKEDHTIEEDYFFNSSYSNNNTLFVGCKNGSLMIIN